MIVLPIDKCLPFQIDNLRFIELIMDCQVMELLRLTLTDILKNLNEIAPKQHDKKFEDASTNSASKTKE